MRNALYMRPVTILFASILARETICVVILLNVLQATKEQHADVLLELEEIQWSFAHQLVVQRMINAQVSKHA